MVERNISCISTEWSSEDGSWSKSYRKGWQKSHAKVTNWPPKNAHQTGCMSGLVTGDDTGHSTGFDNSEERTPAQKQALFVGLGYRKYVGTWATSIFQCKRFFHSHFILKICVILFQRMISKLSKTKSFLKFRVRITLHVGNFLLPTVIDSSRINISISVLVFQ